MTFKSDQPSVPLSKDKRPFSPIFKILFTLTIALTARSEVRDLDSVKFYQLASEDQNFQNSESLTVQRRLETVAPRYPLRIHVDFSNLEGMLEEKRLLVESKEIRLSWILGVSYFEFICSVFHFKSFPSDSNMKK